MGFRSIRYDFEQGIVVSEMKFNWKLLFPFKHNQLLMLKLLLPILLMGIAFRFLFAGFGDIPANLDTSLTEKNIFSAILDTHFEAWVNKIQKPLEGDQLMLSFMLLCLD